MIRVKESPETKDQLDKILNPVVKKWFYSKFDSYSLPQLYGVLDIHSRKNILISAPTGATKTLTGFLSILNELVDSSQKGILEDKVYCIYISPLKALNYDISVNLLNPLKEMEKQYGKKLGIRVGVRTGDTTQKEKTDMLKNPPHILITTPESLAILLSTIKFKEKLKGVEWAIIDEIHALAENKRGVHLSMSMERLSHLSSYVCRVGLSATVAPLESIANFLVGNERDCEIVDVQFIKQLDLKVLSPADDLINITHKAMQTKMYDLMNELIQKHKTTLVFTNTRAATERVVDNLKEKFPKSYTENIGAHHGSLSKQIRHKIESNLREGKLKTVVCSTSLELGIDIGYIDLVICIGSPKSVARALQRIGRSGHQLHSKTKGRIIVMDRDDLIECSVLVKSGIEKKIDRIHIPTNCLDVLAQHIFGMALEQNWEEKELYGVIKKSFCYKDLSWSDYQQLLSYLAGEFVSLEERYIFAKIWRKDGLLGRKGRMSRVIYMTNIGTIPSQSGIDVKVGDLKIGSIEESFLERLRKGDVFVLGGHTYQFLYSRGQTAQVMATSNRPPTVPSWFSEMLPLSYDLSQEIGKFRRLMEDRFSEKKSKNEILNFINEYLYVDRKAANAIYGYFKEQYDYVKVIPNDKTIVVEHYTSEIGKKIVFHTLYGRRVNDCISRALGFAISRTQHKDIEIGINDNGFYISYEKKLPVMEVFKMLKSEKLELIMNNAISSSEVYKRRFRHCAARALMILRNYKGKEKKVGRQQVSSSILMNALKRIDPEFTILKEARREVLEDLMDIDHSKEVLKKIQDGLITIKEINTNVPSPFSFQIVLMGYLDILKMEDKIDFLRRMHHDVIAKIALTEGRKGMPASESVKQEMKKFSYEDLWGEEEEKKEKKKLTHSEKLKSDLEFAARKVNLDSNTWYEIVRLIDGDKTGFKPPFIDFLTELTSGTIPKCWSDDLIKFLKERIDRIK